MKLKIYSIFDEKSGFGSPTVDISDQVAMRNFAHALVTTRGIMATSPIDFSLWCLGEFDSENGMIDSVGSEFPRRVCSGTDLFIEDVAASFRHFYGGDR